MKIFIVFFSVFLLTACQSKSDIDKCIDAKWELFSVQRQQFRETLEKDNNLPKGENPFSKFEKEFELTSKLNYRMECLDAQAGK
jgi:hypothetical protein